MNREKELTLFKEFEVTSADTDMFGRLKISGLSNFLIQSAISSADKLGFGLQYLKTENLFWVLSRLDVEVYKQAYWYDKITVETWPKTSDGIIYVRDFIVRNSKNEVLARATSGWLAVDLLRKRPKKITGIVSEIFHSLKNKKAIEEMPTRLKPVECEKITEIQTSYYDLDLNRHVTTTRYIDWLLDSFDIEFHKNNYAKKLKINFLKETKPLEKLELQKKQISEKQFHFESMNITSAKNAFRAEIEF